MNKLAFTFYRNLLWLWDVLSLNLVLFLCSLSISRAEAVTRGEYHVLFLAFNLSWMAGLYLTNLYLRRHWLDIKNFTVTTFKSLLLTGAFVMAFMFFYHYPYSRVFIISSFTGFLMILIVNRFAFNWLIKSLVAQSKLGKNIVVLGYNNQSKKLVNYFNKEGSFVRVAGCFDDTEAIDESVSLPFRGSLSQCMDFVKENQVREIYSTIAPEKNPYLYELANDAEKNFVHFRFVPDLQSLVNRDVFVDFVDDIPVLSFRRDPLENTGARIAKRIFDVVFSSLVIIFVLSWLLPILALLIKLDSKGGIFFIQLRSGKNNKTFPCIKLRTLHENNEAHLKQVTRNDSRVTKVGRFLRKTNLDELPQFFNVLLGDMSIIGPRPHMLKHTEEFAGIYKEYMVRHFIKPGLTGWAQVHNLRGEITNPDLLRKRVEHDVWYMENWSVWLDIKIVFYTIWVTIVGSETAY